MASKLGNIEWLKPAPIPSCPHPGASCSPGTPSLSHVHKMGKALHRRAWSAFRLAGVRLQGSASAQLYSRLEDANTKPHCTLECDPGK